ncbi:hypothetical protein ACH5RR_036216 [Cinchona calisaya]|uniref:Uncharacterized protein n=1 Tax=Cinchona calisaya TaxID=153742 RepID=A0ABD2Y7B5_9GENT
MFCKLYGMLSCSVESNLIAIFPCSAMGRKWSDKLSSEEKVITLPNFELWELVAVLKLHFSRFLAPRVMQLRHLQTTVVCTICCTRLWCSMIQILYMLTHY